MSDIRPVSSADIRLSTIDTPSEGIYDSPYLNHYEELTDYHRPHFYGTLNQPSPTQPAPTSTLATDIIERPKELPKKQFTCFLLGCCSWPLFLVIGKFIIAHGKIFSIVGIFTATVVITGVTLGGLAIAGKVKKKNKNY